MAILKDSGVLVGGSEEREDKERKKERKDKMEGKCLRSCLMCWAEIYRNDLPDSFEIHKVINSCSLLSAEQNKSAAMQPSALK